MLDEQAGELVLINDRTGSYPIYWFTSADDSHSRPSSAPSLRAHPSPSLNPAAVADLLKFGFPMGDKTLAAGVDMLPAASTLTYRSADGSVHHRRRTAPSPSSFSQTDVDRTTYDESIERGIFASRWTARSSGSHRYGLSLSGGLDTRVMLSALDRLGRSQALSTFTLGGRGCADEVIANQLSRMARTKHTFVALDDHYLDDSAADGRHGWCR